MTRSQAALSFALLSSIAVAGVGLAGCAPEVPAQPSYSADVAPLLLARCVRCHDNPVHPDPNMDPPAGVAPFSLNAPQLDMLSPAAKGFIPVFPVAAKYTGKTAGTRRMPPPPAEPLADWEIKVLANFAAEGPDTYRP